MTKKNFLFQRLKAVNATQMWILGGVIFIVMLTLFPFKFQAIAWGKKEAAKEFFRNPSDAFDFLGNIFLFMPLGYGLSQWLQPRRWSKRLKLLGIIGISLMSTISIEALQLFLPDRSSSIIDISTNTLGGTLGGAYGLFQWHRLITPIQQWFARHWQKKRSLMIALVLWIVLMLGSTWKLANMMYLRDWNPAFNLMVGNEATGDRPWLGSVKGFSMTDRALSEAEVQQFFANPQFPAQASALADYDLTTAPAPYRDRGRLNLPALEPQSLTPGLDPSWNRSLKSAKVNAGKSNPPSTSVPSVPSVPWYRTQQAPVALTEAIQKTSAFTLALAFEPHSLDQAGPARIISLSQDLSERNFTLGQAQSHLIARLRTPATGNNGSFLELGTPNVLQVNQLHRVVVTYENAILSLYLDPGTPVNRLQFRPEISFFRQIWPNQGRGFPRGPKILKAYPYLFYSLWFLPLGILLGRLLVLMKGDRRKSQVNPQRNFSLSMGSLILGFTIGFSSLVMTLILKPFSSHPLGILLTCLVSALLPIAIQFAVQWLHPIFKLKSAR